MNLVEIELTELIKTKCNSLDLQYWDIQVNLEKGQIFFTCPPPQYIRYSDSFRDKNYFKKCQLIVRDCLNQDYRLKPQNEPLINSNNDFIILIESTKSKALRASEVVSNYYTIPLMEKVNWQIDKEYHALISGVTGSGKSMLMMYFIHQFRQLGSSIHIIDPKESELFVYGKQEKLTNCIGNDWNTVIVLLQQLIEEMKFRQSVVNEKCHLPGETAYSIGLSPLLLVIDELAALVASLTDNKQKNHFFALLKQLMFMGRSAGITVMIGIQKPMADYLPTSIRDQLALRIVLGRKTTKSIRKLVFDSSEDTSISLNDDRIDEWQESFIPTFGGWYQLPSMTEDFSIFESPLLFH